MKTCEKIYKMIAAHTGELSIFICARNWANTDDGILVAENMDEDVFCDIFGDKTPTDWCLCCNSDDGCIEIGFLF